jgi:hypothetical protein
LRFALAVRQPRDVSRSVLSRLGSRAQLSEIHIPKVAARYATTFWFREKKRVHTSQARAASSFTTHQHANGHTKHSIFSSVNLDFLNQASQAGSKSKCF